MSYRITAVGDDWIEVWDGESVVDSGRYKNIDRMVVGIDHGFLKGDGVDISIRLIEREDREVFDQHG